MGFEGKRKPVLESIMNHHGLLIGQQYLNRTPRLWALPLAGPAIIFLYTALRSLPQHPNGYKTKESLELNLQLLSEAFCIPLWKD